MASSGSSELRFEVGLDALTCVGERHQSEAAIRRIGLALDYAASLERVGERRDVGGVVLQAPGELPLRERLHPRAQRYLVQRLEAATSVPDLNQLTRARKRAHFAADYSTGKLCFDDLAALNAYQVVTRAIPRQCVRCKPIADAA